MSPVGVLDALASIGSVLAFLVVLRYGRKRFSRNTWTILLVLLILAVIHDLANLIEWMGILEVPDFIEDFMAVLRALAWPLMLASFIHSRSEAALRESEQLYRTLVESNHAGISVVQDGKMVFVSRRLAEIMGRTVEEMAGNSPLTFLHPEDVAVMDRNMRSRPAGLPADERYTVRALRPHGTTRYLDIIGSVVTWNGRPASLGNIVDVTAQRIVEQNLRQSEERYRTLVENSHAGVAVLQDGKLSFVNNHLAEMLERPIAELIGRSPLEFLHPEDAAVLEPRVNSRQTEVPADERHTVRVFKKSGEERFLNLIVSELTWQGQPASFAHVLDVTDQKVFQEALQESERRFRTIFNDSPESVSLSRLSDGHFLDINHTFLKMLGLKKEDVVGRTSLEMGLWVDRRDRDEFRGILEACGEIENFETVFRLADGVKRSVLVSARVIRSIGEPLILAIVRDITPIKEAEARVRRSLEEKETLLREVHHRVKNNLQVISGLLNLQSRHIDDRQSRAIYKESQNRIVSMALIHEKLYQAQDLARIDFGDYIRDLVRNLMVSYGVADEKVEFVLDTEPSPMVVDTAIPCGLIVNELITNCIRHAFPGNRVGEVRVDFHLLNGDENYELIVSDDGVGFPEGMDVDQSPTLGLKLVKVLVEQLGATLEVKGDAGASFCLRFKEYREAGTVLI